jgi:hypothetical protein
MPTTQICNRSAEVPTKLRLLVVLVQHLLDGVADASADDAADGGLLAHAALVLAVAAALLVGLEHPTLLLLPVEAILGWY